jgi:hypothetical protein
VCGPDTAAAVGDRFRELLVRFGILRSPTPEKIDQVLRDFTRSKNRHNSSHGSAPPYEHRCLAFGEDVFHQLGKTNSGILDRNYSFAHG